MKIQVKILMLCMLFFLSFSYLYPAKHALSQATSFNNNLRQGYSNEEVRNLQIFLNKDQRTRLAQSGPGSLGNETAYFGSITLNAVIKFQDLYYVEVLLPVGLINGTGFFGPSTRKKVNSLLAQGERVIENTALNNGITDPTPDPIQDTLPTEFPSIILDNSASGDQRQEDEESLLLSLSETFSPSVFDVYYPSSYNGWPGDTVTLSGSGFSRTDNTIHFGRSHAIENVKSLGGVEITFKVPNLPPGPYSIAVSNKSGKASTSSFRILNRIISALPVIISVTPATISGGDFVTIKGSGFESTGNTIHTTFVTMDSIPSYDGVTMSFTMPYLFTDTVEYDISDAKEVEFKESDPFPSHMFIENNNGIGKDIIFYIDNF